MKRPEIVYTPAEPGSDLRATVRYALHTPTIFRWLDAGGPAREARGFTRDISPGGVYVLAPECPPPGTSLTMDIYLPAQSPDSDSRRIEIEGRVLRVDPASGAAICGGFSVQNKRVRLCAN